MEGEVGVEAEVEVEVEAEGECKMRKDCGRYRGRREARC